MPAPIYAYAVPLDPASRGLDPGTFVLTIGAQRADGEAMSEADLKKVRAALAADKVSSEKPTASKEKTPKPPAANPKASAKATSSKAKASAKGKASKPAKRAPKAAE